MPDSKSIEQLLNELNKMQKQFDNLEKTSSTKSVKKKATKIVTDLKSDKIDSDFFKTATAPIKKEMPKKEMETSIEEPFFTLDTDESVESTKDLEIKSVKDISSTDIDETSKTDAKTTNPYFFDKDLKEAKSSPEEKTSTSNKQVDAELLTNKNSTEIKEIATKKIESLENKVIKKIDQSPTSTSNKDNSYLSIKQKLDRIKEEIALRETKESEKSKAKVKKLPTSIRKSDALKPKQTTLDKADLKKEVFKEAIVTKKANALSPTKRDNDTTKKNTKSLNVIDSNKSKKKVVTNVVTNKPNVKETISTPKLKSKKDGVDMLTIIILVLVIILLVSAWVLLK